MKFKEIKKQVLDCLKKGQVEHEQRDDINVKNLLAVGQISLDDVANIIGRSGGNEYSHSPHHVFSGIEPNTVFISVHN